MTIKGWQLMPSFDPPPADAGGGDPPATPPATPPAGPTIEQLQETINQLQQGQAELRGQNERLAAELAARAQPPAPQAPTFGVDFAAKYNIPVEAVQDIVTETERIITPRLEQRYMQAQALVEARNQFYVEHPDLREHQSLIQSIANGLQRENPNMTLEVALKETAKRARTYIKSIQDKTLAGLPPQPPSILPGGGSRDGAPPAGGGPEPVLTPEEELRNDINMRREATAKKR